MPIGGKKGRGAKAAAAAAARSALKNLGEKAAPGLIPRSTPPRSATALAYQSPSKIAQITAPVTTPASTSNTQVGIAPSLTSSMPMEEIQTVAPTNLPPAAALPSQPAKVPVE